MVYVDGFVLAVKKKDLPAYRKMARAAGKVWREHGALEFRECVGDDLLPQPPEGLQGPVPARFADLVGLRRGETVLFSYIVFASKAQRDRVNKKVMADPRLETMMAGKKMPFDVARMAYGGFRTLVEA